jgi:FkbM family methyltransferase
MKNAAVNYHPGKLTRFYRKLVWYFTVYLLPEREVTISTRNGLLTFNSKDKTTGRNLYIYRNHEFDDMMDCVAILKNDDLLSQDKGRAVLDVGGYIGMSSTAFLLENIFDMSVAFEPFPGSYQLLQKNIDNNRLQDRLIAHNMALSDAEGSLNFELSKKNYGDHRIKHDQHDQVDAFGESNRQVITVRAARFDDLDDSFLGVAKDDIELVWMDIQGHEARFIEGASGFFRDHPRVPVVMEFWPYAIQRSGVSRNEFLRLVHSLFSGYYRLESEGFRYFAMDTLGDFFDEHNDPHKGSSIILCNRID